MGLNLDSRLGLTFFGIQVRKVLLAPHLTCFPDILHSRTQIGLDQSPLDKRKPERKAFIL